MKPESEWFRPPERKAWATGEGRPRCFVWTAEPERGAGVFGVYYYVFSDPRPQAERGLVDRIHDAARRVLLQRVAAGESYPNGSLYEEMFWNPEVRWVDGRLEVTNAEATITSDPKEAL